MQYNLIDHQKLIRSAKVGACADAHLSLPRPVRFRSSAHHAPVIYASFQVRVCAMLNLLPFAAFAYDQTM